MLMERLLFINPIVRELSYHVIFLRGSLFNWLFIYFWLFWVFVAACASSSCSEWGLPFVAVH